MEAKIGDLQKKEVISVKDGVKLGYVDDVVFDLETARIQTLVVYGRAKLFGLLGRGPDCMIPWEKITVIGEDTLLVSLDETPVQRPRSGKLISRWTEFWNK